MFIYVIVCSETLKIYVGQHKGENLQKYLQTKLSNAKRNSGRRSHLFAAMKNHPKETWSIYPLVSDVETRAELDDLERHYIRVLNAQNPDIGYNICDGGEGYTGPGYWLGKKRSLETNQKISASKIGTTVANSGSFKPGQIPWNAGISAPQCNRRKGIKMKYHSAETRRRALSGLIPGKPGGHRSDEARKKMALAHQNCSCPHHVAARERKMKMSY